MVTILRLCGHIPQEFSCGTWVLLQKCCIFVFGKSRFFLNQHVNKLWLGIICEDGAFLLILAYAYSNVKVVLKYDFILSIFKISCTFAPSKNNNTMTLYELSNLINENGGWYTDKQDQYIDIIKNNGWRFYDGSDLDICSDGTDSIIFDPEEEGMTMVVNECLDDLHE